MECILKWSWLCGILKGAIVIPFFEAINTKLIEKLSKTVIHAFIRYEANYTIYETFDYAITRHKRNSVYDNTLVAMYYVVTGKMSRN